MNAVNLIPLERRRGEALAMPGMPFLGLLAALVLALVGTFAYVSARNQISTRQSELSHVRAGTAEWSAAAARYAPAISALKQHATLYVQLGAALGERAEWSQLLGQIAGVMPAHAALTTLSATASLPSSSTTASTTGTAGTPSGITLSGCAASQAVVADTMVALRRLSGVSGVSLSTSTVQASTGGSGSCAHLPDQFNLALQFTPATSLVHLLDNARTASANVPTTSTTAQAASTSNSTGAAR